MYFIFNGVDSRDIGLKIKDVPFDILPNRRITETELVRYDGTLYRDEKTYESYTLDLDCVMVDNFTMDNIRRVKNLFKGGEGEIIFSHKPTNIYKVRLTNTINFIELLNLTGSCLLSFKVEPFSYLSEGKVAINVPNNTTITNLGNYESKPLIKVLNPTANVVITINGKQMKFTKVAKTFIIDVDMEDVYGETGENLNAYMDLSSDFLTLQEDKNVIEYVGAGGLLITPNWREL